MISQIKVQLNLYSHRSPDNIIIEKLGLADCSNVNKVVKDILTTLATEQTLIVDNSNNSNELLDEIRQLKDQINKLTVENNLLKDIAYSNQKENSKNEEAITRNEETSTQCKSKLNPQLISSIKNMDI